MITSLIRCLNHTIQWPTQSTPRVLFMINKGKKFLNDNLKSTEQVKFMKFIKLLLRSDFISSNIPKTDVNEMLYIIRLFEQQTNLITEYKKNLIKGVDEFQPLNPIEFEITVEKYKATVAELNSIQEFALKNFEMIKVNKENQIFKDLKKILDKCRELQTGIYEYQDLIENFQKIRNLAAKFCKTEFDLKVELICEYNLQ